MSKKLIPAALLQVLLCALVAVMPFINEKMMNEKGTEYSVRIKEGSYYFYSDGVTFDLQPETVKIPGGYASFSASNEEAYLYLAGSTDEYDGFCTYPVSDEESVHVIKSVFSEEDYFSTASPTEFDLFLKSHEVLLNFVIYKDDIVFEGVTVDGTELRDFFAQ